MTIGILSKDGQTSCVQMVQKVVIVGSITSVNTNHLWYYSGCSHSKFKVEKQFNRYELEMGLVMFSTRRFMHVWEACLPSYKLSAEHPTPTHPFSAFDPSIPSIHKPFGSRIRSLGANGSGRTSLSCFYPPPFRLESSLAPS
ncbi:hypothetical protein HanPSC8_Chr14g0601311 [Helianthus annuus]|nr:hypothetical protein HanPSC8_Chr14g0601311 [Helianthus annuus]